MKAIPYEVGREVVSLQGHDKGRRFLIIGLPDERYALIADGDSRKLSHPKKKQRKHLHAEPFIATDVIPAIAARLETADSSVRKALKASAQQGSSGADRITNKEEYALVQE